MSRAELLRFYMEGPLAVCALWAPWSILCVAPDPARLDGQPAKRHETRHWYPRRVTLPMAVAIHSAKKFDRITLAALADARFSAALKRSGYWPHDPRPLLSRGMTAPGALKPIPLGSIVGLARVTSLWSLQPLSMQAQLDGVQALDPAELTDDDRAFGYFEPHPEDPAQGPRYAWRLADSVLLADPVPHTGRQDALYPVDGETRDQINTQLRWLEMAAA